MPTDLHAAWFAFAGTPLFGLPVTILAYLAAARLQRALHGAALVNPVLIAIALIIAILKLTGTPYATYFGGARLLHLLLGPATVALAVPLAANLEHVRRHLPEISIATIAGSIVSAASGVLLVRLCGGSVAIAASMAPKAATTPIAMGVAAESHGIPALTASLAILGGVFVACVGETVLRWVRATDWRAYGLAAGTAGSGIAAARVYMQNPAAAAFAGLAIGLNGLITAIIVPLAMHAWLPGK
ncbi:MAG: LrgB family protein [Acetobacteraceae bacterium]|nr:LrgB family protein [Acetobacteraceae bacterium]